MNNTKGQNKNDSNRRDANNSDVTGNAEVGDRAVGSVLVDILSDNAKVGTSEFAKLEVAGGAVLRHPDNIVRAIGVKVFYSQLGETKVKEVYVDQQGNVSLNPNNFCPLRKVINLLDN